MNQKGFSLIEVTIALTILAIGLSTVYYTQINIGSRNIRARDYAEASQALERKFEELYQRDKRRSFGDLAKTEEGSFEKPFERFKWRKEIREIDFPDLTNLFLGRTEGDAAKSQADGPETLIVRSLVTALRESMRELVVTVTWGNQKLSQSVYLIDYTKELALTP